MLDSVSVMVQYLQVCDSVCAKDDIMTDVPTSGNSSPSSSR